jgi:hypothetical protein
MEKGTASAVPFSIVRFCVRTGTAGPSNGQGPEGRPLNFSPARKGWETERQDCGALEARH